MEHTLLALFALLLNAIIGGPRSLYLTLGADKLTHLPALCLRGIERRLNRSHRSPAQRYQRGWIMLVAALLCAVAAGLLIEQTPAIVHIALIAALLPMRSSYDLANEVRRQLKAGNKEAAHQAFKGTLWRHHAMLDEHGLARAAIELLAMHFSEKIVSPLLWYIVGGLPGFFCISVITLLEETLTRPTDEEKHFSRPSHQLHRWAHLIPALLASLLWIVTCFITRGKVIRQLDYRLRSPSAITLSAAAAALNVSLGGPSSSYATGTWYGTGTARTTQRDISRALWMYVVLQLVLFVLIGLYA